MLFVTLFRTTITTPIGKMIAVADEAYVYMLDFLDDISMQAKMAFLQTKAKKQVEEGSLPLFDQLKKELDLYFKGRLQNFSLPIFSFGTVFQQRVWQELRAIPYGTTNSYAQIASSMGEPLATRAAANANGKNKLAILIPCHRVIQSDGRIGGYNGGIERKRELLALEGVFL